MTKEQEIWEQIQVETRKKDFERINPTGLLRDVPFEQQMIAASMFQGQARQSVTMMNRLRLEQKMLPVIQFAIWDYMEMLLPKLFNKTYSFISWGVSSPVWMINNEFQVMSVRDTEIEISETTLQDIDGLVEELTVWILNNVTHIYLLSFRENETYDKCRIYVSGYNANKN